MWLHTVSLETEIKPLHAKKSKEQKTSTYIKKSEQCNQNKKVNRYYLQKMKPALQHHKAAVVVKSSLSDIMTEMSFSTFWEMN